MLKKKLNPYHIILASKSPRRQFLLKELGLDFEIRTKDTEESFPRKLKGKSIALFLCKKKAEAFKNELKQNDLLLTADTIVCINGKILNKPANHHEAVKMLKMLSGKMHTVYTGICIATLLSLPLPGERKRKSGMRMKFWAVSTKVYFQKLSRKEIDFYVRNYKPYDKAGAYGAQECLPAGMNPCSKDEMQFLKKLGKTKMIKNSIYSKPGRGYASIRKISGSYFNVMGLPVKELYEELMKYV